MDCRKFEDVVPVPNKKLRDLLLKWGTDGLAADAADQLLLLARKHCPAIEDLLVVIEQE